MKEIWQRLSYMGVRGEKLPDYLRARVILTNRMGMLGALFSLPMFFMWNKFFPASFVMLCFGFVLLSLPYLNLKKRYTLSRWLITVTPSVAVLFVASFFDYTAETFPTGGRILAFAMALAPMFFWSFREQKNLLTTLVIDILCYFGWYFLNPLIDVPGLEFIVDPLFFSVSVATVAFAVIIFQFFFIEQYYRYSEKKLEEALQKAHEKTMELQKSEEILKRQNENLRRTSEELQRMKEELEFKNQALEKIKAELEENERAIKREQERTQKIKEYDDLLRRYLEKDAQNITNIFLAQLAKEFKIGKMVLTLFTGNKNIVFSGFAIESELYGKDVTNSLLTDMAKNNFLGALDLETAGYHNMLFLHTGITKMPAKAIMILPLKYQNIIFGGMEMLFFEKPDKNATKLIKDIINNFATVLFYKLEREKLIQTS